ncbi:hypothetical protein NDU88_003864 [Pleurodeles waltl]|uniref:Uncharacterized protein n=1 Tax=Pleurodeles waltl TaxID=8319 RepID=A0AAV7WQM3_PLEWA|nr:hypothetical protein NDU88_003864 [Pleurodeles waltl]
MRVSEGRARRERERNSLRDTKPAEEGLLRDDTYRRSAGMRGMQVSKGRGSLGERRSTEPAKGTSAQ